VPVRKGALAFPRCRCADRRNVEVGQALKGTDVVEVLNRLRFERRAPKIIFRDNGSEFTSQIMDLWPYQNGVKIDFSRPGKPTDNAYVESFNGTLLRKAATPRVISSLRDRSASAKFS